MSDPTPSAVVGCLLDVSGSMRSTLEAGISNEHVIERLQAVLRAALKLAQTQQQRNPDAFMFVGVFGLGIIQGQPYPPAVDLCGVADILISDLGNHSSGHDLLIALANQNDVAHVSRYIREKLTSEEARIVDAHLRKHPAKVNEFIEAIPPEERVNNLQSWSRTAGSIFGILAGAALAASPAGAAAVAAATGAAAVTAATGGAGATAVAAATGGAGAAAVAAATGGAGAAAVAAATGTQATAIAATISAAAIGGRAAGSAVAHEVEDRAVENSDALAKARRIQKEWLWDFAELEPRPVSEVVDILQKLQDHEDHHRGNVQGNDNDDKFYFLRQYMYGLTPMCYALKMALEAFRSKPEANHRVLVLVSDGLSTDGDPISAASELRSAGVSIATVYLTNNRSIPQRALYYQARPHWDRGIQTLFQMSSRIPGSTHPIPVLASVGWKVPSAGEIALFSIVCSTSALDEFCSLLLSARFGSADALLNIIGRVHFDDYIDKEHSNVRMKPSDQGREAVCYAHATASVVHMALLRIISREGGVPTLCELRAKILSKFPEPMRDITKVLQAVCGWYRPLRYQKVNENGARQAVLLRRPVLVTFGLSDPGWDEFCRHFDGNSETRTSVLTQDQMGSHRSEEDHGGHAVVLVGCAPKSLTFLNSWGSSWGDHGSFSVDNHNALAGKRTDVDFYDIYWVEEDLTSVERQAYNMKVDEELRRRADHYPSIFELEYRCPKCRENAPLAEFTGSVRRAICPNCEESFEPEAGYLVQALYLRAGLNDAV